VVLSHPQEPFGHAVQGFIPGNRDQAASHALEGGSQPVGAVEMSTLIKTFVADVASGVKVVLVPLDSDDSSVIVQGHDQAAVAATKKASRDPVVHETSSSDWLIN
jgi:hypothetical protein